MQYSAVQRIEQILHCSSSVSFVISPSLSIFCIKPVAAFKLVMSRRLALLAPGFVALETTIRQFLH